jgi:hypothetical protein
MTTSNRKRKKGKVAPTVRRVTVTIDLPEDVLQEADRELAVKLLIVPTGCATIHAVDRIAAAVLRAVAK